MGSIWRLGSLGNASFCPSLSSTRLNNSFFSCPRSSMYLPYLPTYAVGFRVIQTKPTFLTHLAYLPSHLIIPMSPTHPDNLPEPTDNFPEQTDNRQITFHRTDSTDITLQTELTMQPFIQWSLSFPSYGSFAIIAMFFSSSWTCLLLKSVFSLVQVCPYVYFCICLFEMCICLFEMCICIFTGPGRQDFPVGFPLLAPLPTSFNLKFIIQPYSLF